MAEVPEPQEPQIPPAPIEPPSEPPVVPPATPDDDDGKPTGDDPQAVRARKEYQARKRAETEREQARLENIRLSERLKTIEEERAKAQTKPQEREITIADVNQAVDEGKISRADADRYIDEEILPRRIDKVLSQREQVAQQKAPIEKAIQDIGEFRTHLKFLDDRAHPEFQKVVVKYQELVRDGLPNNEVTERLAIEMTHGSLAALRKKAELATLNANPRTIPVDGGGGGGGGGTNGKVDVSKATPAMIAIWDREGWDQAARERQFKIFKDLEAAKRQR